MPSIDQYTRREARIRGSGNREIKVEELNISSPDGSKHHDTFDFKPEDTQTTRLEDERLEELNQESREYEEEYTVKGRRVKKHDSKQSFPISNHSSTLREKRKLTFSSDEEEDDNDFMNYRKSETSPDPDVKADEKAHLKTDLKADLKADGFMDLDPSDPPIKEEQNQPLKRKRGRPKKGQGEKKVAVVTRRSKRVVQNPSLQKNHMAEGPRASHPKPFSSMALLLAHKAKADTNSGARSLGSNSKGKQRPLTIDTERLYTNSTRDRRFNLTTLDVLKHFVDDHSPRPSANDIISENVVLTEFKAHLKFYLDHLVDLHSSVVDISHDLSSVQKKKNDVRRTIVELQKKHSLVGAELSVERRKYYEMKEKHQQFMSMVGSIQDLQSSIRDDTPPRDLSGDVLSSLTDIQRVLNPDYGMPAQLSYVVKSLGELQDGTN